MVHPEPAGGTGRGDAETKTLQVEDALMTANEQTRREAGSALCAPPAFEFLVAVAAAGHTIESGKPQCGLSVSGPWYRWFGLHKRYCGEFPKVLGGF